MVWFQFHSLNQNISWCHFTQYRTSGLSVGLLGIMGTLQRNVWKWNSVAFKNSKTRGSKWRQCMHRTIWGIRQMLRKSVGVWRIKQVPWFLEVTNSLILLAPLHNITLSGIVFHSTGDDLDHNDHDLTGHDHDSHNLGPMWPLILTKISHQISSVTTWQWKNEHSTTVFFLVHEMCLSWGQ